MIYNCPENETVSAGSENEVMVTWQPPTATDNLDGSVPVVSDYVDRIVYDMQLQSCCINIKQHMVYSSSLTDSQFVGMPRKFI